MAGGIGVAETYMQGRMFISGSTVESYTYSRPIRYGYEREYEIKRKPEPGEKRTDNLTRAQRAVRQIVWANLGRYTKFLTLTYEETVLDVDTFKKNFDAFRKGMSRQGYKLRYLYVLERQKERGEKEGNEGCIHCHIVLFNDEYIPWNIIKKCWHYGNIDIHVLYGTRYQDGFECSDKINDLAAYVSKYITKDCVVLPGNKTYCCSLGLERATLHRDFCYMWDTGHGLDGVPDSASAQLFDSIESITAFKFSRCASFSFVDSKGEQQKIGLIYKQGRLNYA